MRKSRLRVSLLYPVLMFALAFTQSAWAEQGVDKHIMKLVKSGPAHMLDLKGHGMNSAQIDKIVLELYSKRYFEPIWLESGKPSQRAEVIRAVLDSSSAEGLKPESYRIKSITKYWETDESRDLAKLDILLTLGLGGYIADVSEGSIEPHKVDSKLFANARNVDVDIVALVRQALDSKDLMNFLKSAPPKHRYYSKLREALSKYRKIALNGGWQKIPAGDTLKPGMQDPRVPLVRQRLSITGDYAGADTGSELYDDSLKQAVSFFQERNHLEQDGALGKQTLTALNIPVEQRIEQIILNMERWRWTSRELETRQLFVNIAGYHVAGIRDREIEILMPVIVGKTYHKTPVFSEKIEYVEFNPFWNVPASISRNEYLPKLRKNPRVLQSKHIRIFEGWGENAPEIDPTTVDWSKVTKKGMGRYRLRQDPGPRNALGTVKFIFPNAHNVYLHDTPSHGLFSRNKRTFSHGCIRVSRPHELAVYILGGKEKGWDLQRVKEIIASGKRKVVNLETPMPVNILYRTAVALDDGVMRFRDDVYGRDAILSRAMFSQQERFN